MPLRTWLLLCLLGRSPTAVGGSFDQASSCVRCNATFRNSKKTCKGLSGAEWQINWHIKGHIGIILFALK
jgi:hypothetical protein